MLSIYKSKHFLKQDLKFQAQYGQVRLCPGMFRSPATQRVKPFTSCIYL